MVSSKEGLLQLLLAPSPLLCRDAFSLLQTSRSFMEDLLKVVALLKWYCKSWVECDQLESSVELLPLWRQLLLSLHSVKVARVGGKDGVPSKWHLDTVADLKAALDAFSAARTAKADPPCEFILASICGAGYPNHLAELRRRWDVQGYQSNMATCSLGHVMSETREGFIDIRLLCEMRRFKSPDEHEHGVAFYMFPLAESVGCLWDGTEEMPKLFCTSATGGVEMSSLDLYRLEGKPKAVTRGAVTLTVNEGDLREELKMEPLPSTLRPPDDSDGDFILEDAVRVETFDSKPYRSTLKATANALRRFDESEKVNFLFALYGPKLLLRETSPSPDPEDPEEEFMSEDEEIIP